MKKFYLIPAILGMMLAVSCGGGSKSAPQKVADKFMNAFIVNLNIDEIRTCISEDLKDDFPALEDADGFGEALHEILKSHFESHKYEFTYNAVDSEIHENEATICYTLTAKANPDYRGDASLELKKANDGKWYVTDYDVDIDEDAIDTDF